MLRLPENVRRITEKLVQNLRAQEPVSGIGLFGSLSRGDAEPSSDVDLLIVDEQNLNYEYVERLEYNGLFVDLNHIPKKWITSTVPPEMDQRLYELSILYDRDWSLERAKEWMSKTYPTPERIDIRMNTHIVKSDIYLSRATSARAKGDLQSTCVFASTGVKFMLETVMELNLTPISNSHFIETLKESTEKLRIPRFFDNFLSIARLHRFSHNDTQKTISLFNETSNDIATFVGKHASVLSSMHPSVRAKLGYFRRRSFSKGMVDRSLALLDKGRPIEATHYVLHTLIDMLENYAWLTTANESTKLDYTTLLHSLGRSRKTRKTYENAVEAFNLGNVDCKEADRILKLAKETVLNVRRHRKGLTSKLVDSMTQL